MSGAEPLLFGAAMGAPAAGVIGPTTAAATTGLFGSAGAFSWGATAATLGAVGSAASAVGSIMQGQQASRMYRQQAEIQRQQAEQARSAAASDAAEYARRQSAASGTSRALMGASGLRTEGTPLMVAGDAGAEAEFQRLKILYGGEIGHQRGMAQSGMSRQEAANARSGGYFRAGASLLEGGARTAAYQRGWGLN